MWNESKRETEDPIDTNDMPIDIDDGCRTPLTLLTAHIDMIELAAEEPLAVDEVEVAVYPPMTNTFDLEHLPGPGEIVLLQVGQTKSDRQW